MPARLLLVLLCVLGLAVTASAQEKAAVFDFNAIGVSSETASAATQIFRNELDATGKFSVIPKAEVDAALAEKGITDFTCYAPACASEYGFAAKADKAVIGTLTMMGERVIAAVSLVSVVRKEVEFTDTFSAASLTDLNAALRKLAKAVADRKKIESEVTRYAITEEESQEARRKASFITYGFGFGVGFPIGEDSYLGVDNLKNLVGFTRYEAGKFVVETSMGLQWGSGGKKERIQQYEGGPYTTIEDKSVFVFPIDIGLRYIVNRESDFTPFFGGGVGLHFIGAEDQSGVTYAQSDQAFALHVAGGVYAFQSYDFHVALEARYVALFTDAFANSDMSQQIGMMLTVSRKHVPSEQRGCGRMY
jgi:hypothetical protein